MKKSREQIQKEALGAWMNKNRRATIEAITGIGKTRIAMEAVKTLPLNAKILFLAEVKDREVELKKEIKKWNVKHKNIEFACYQSAYKWTGKNYDLVIADRFCSL